MNFPDLLADRAKNWYRQLSRDVRANWPALQKAFESEYCGATVTPQHRYYNMSRKSNEEHVDYLYRLNVQAIEAGIKYESFSEGASHIQHFINTCDDPTLARQLSLQAPRSVKDLRDALLTLSIQEARLKRSDAAQSKVRFTESRKETKAKEDRSGRSGSRSKPIEIHAIAAGQYPSSDEGDDSPSDFEDSERTSMGSDSDLEANEGDLGADGIPRAAGEVLTFLSKIFAASNAKETQARPRQHSSRSDRQKCSHCGSESHSDRTCWKRLTCDHCGRAHPSDYCYSLCKGCGKVHDRGKCHLEEVVNQLKAWYDPTVHVGVLPPSVEKWLN